MNTELLQRLDEAGIKAKDYQYVDLFRDFTKMMSAGHKTTYAVAVLADRYSVSERKVYGLIRRFAGDCTNGAV